MEISCLGKSLYVYKKLLYIKSHPHKEGTMWKDSVSRSENLEFAKIEMTRSERLTSLVSDGKEEGKISCS